MPCPLLIACSIVRSELDAMAKAEFPETKIVYMDSMLHMAPERLASELSEQFQAMKNTPRAVLVYGDCCPSMSDWDRTPGISRTQGINCCELLLGHEEYHKLLAEGVFFLLPEWLHRWREVFSAQLGLTQENASSLMREMHRKLLYLDTGASPVSTSLLEECSQYCGLPYEVRRIDRQCFAGKVREALARIKDNNI